MPGSLFSGIIWNMNTARHSPQPSVPTAPSVSCADSFLPEGAGSPKAILREPAGGMAVWFEKLWSCGYIACGQDSPLRLSGQLPLKGEPFYFFASLPV